MIDKQYLKQLMYENFLMQEKEPENDIIWEQNLNKRFTELSKNLIDTINYIDTCDEIELSGASECFDELSEHFKSQELIDCVERNITRFDNPELQQQLKMELEYMKMYL